MSSTNVTDPNAELLRLGYEAFASGDVPAIRRLLAEDMTWRVAGRTQLSGDYHGHAEILGLLSKRAELSDHTFRVDGEEVLAGGDRVAVVHVRIGAWTCPPPSTNPGQQIQFEGVKQRRLFALLALRAPDAVSANELTEALWGEHIPSGVHAEPDLRTGRDRRQLKAERGRVSTTSAECQRCVVSLDP